MVGLLIQTDVVMIIVMDNVRLLCKLQLSAAAAVARLGRIDDIRAAHTELFYYPYDNP